jgi:hypothetical protein
MNLSQKVNEKEFRLNPGRRAKTVCAAQLTLAHYLLGRSHSAGCGRCCTTQLALARGLLSPSHSARHSQCCTAHQAMGRPMGAWPQSVHGAWLRRMARPAVVFWWLSSDEESTKSLRGLRRIHMARWSAPPHTSQRGRQREATHW